MAPAAANSTIDDFTVMVTKKETVSGVLPLQEHWLTLSNLDLLLPPLDVGVFFCYKKPSGSSSSEKWSFSSMVSILKKSLAQALVSYYALAGEVVSSSLGEPELLCNNRGVDFYEAYADIQLRQLHLYDPDASVEGKLVPPKKEGVLSVQATELKCGGVVVACTFDHRMADAYSSNMFLVSWAEMAQSKSLSIQPSFRRSLLNPRRPGSYHPSINSTYVPLSSLPPPNESAEEAHKMISRIYYITAEDINTLQSRASSNGFKRTKLESLTALLWQIVARSEKAAAEKKCAMGIVVDGRTRLNTGDSPISISNYFGNVLSIPYGEEKVEDLMNRPLNWVADAVHRYLKDGANKEHFLGLIDWVEERRPELAVAKIYCRGSDDGAAFVVSSGQQFPVSKVDFGWGKPVFGSYHFPWGGNSGYVMPMPSMSREGDWVVYMHLSKGQLDLLEAEEGHFFRPVTANYINLAASPAAAAAVE